MPARGDEGAVIRAGDGRHALDLVVRSARPRWDRCRAGAAVRRLVR